MKTEYYYSGGIKLDPLPSDIDIRMKINMDLKDPIQKMIRNMRAVHALQLALKNANLEFEYNQFYKNQIVDILYDMDLWILLNPAMTDKIEKHKVLITTQLALYQQSKELAKSLKSGYNVRSALG